MSIVLIQKPWSLVIRHSVNCFVFFVGLATAAAGCERLTPTVSNGLPLPAQTFEHVERLPIAVSNVHIVRGDDTISGRTGDFSISLHDRAVQYLSRKFETRGVENDGQLVARIEDVKVQHMQKQSQRPILQTIGVGMTDYYALRLSLRLEHHDDSGRVLHGEVISVGKKLNISEHASLASREQDQFEAVEDMFVLIDPEVNRVIKEKMNL